MLEVLESLQVVLTSSGAHDLTVFMMTAKIKSNSGMTRVASRPQSIEGVIMWATAPYIGCHVLNPKPQTFNSRSYIQTAPSPQTIDAKAPNLDKGLGISGFGLRVQDLAAHSLEVT